LFVFDYLALFSFLDFLLDLLLFFFVFIFFSIFSLRKIVLVFSLLVDYGYFPIFLILYISVHLVYIRLFYSSFGLCNFLVEFFLKVYHSLFLMLFYLVIFKNLVIWICDWQFSTIFSCVFWNSLDFTLFQKLSLLQ
jgi:hypothetical protein